MQVRGSFDMKEPYYRQLNTWAQTVPQAATPQHVTTVPGLSLAVGDVGAGQQQQLLQVQPLPAAAAGVGVDAGAAAAAAAGTGAAVLPGFGAAAGGQEQSAAAGVYALAV
jgi:hypothetical protein